MQVTPKKSSEPTLEEEVEAALDDGFADFGSDADDDGVAKPSSPAPKPKTTPVSPAAPKAKTRRPNQKRGRSPTPQAGARVKVLAEKKKSPGAEDSPKKKQQRKNGAEYSEDCRWNKSQKYLSTRPCVGAGVGWVGWVLR